MSRTIFCLEPWNGNHNQHDTGLGNRLIHWAAIYYISTLYDNCKIIVEEKYWPELEFLDLPNTESSDIDSEYIKNNYILLSSQDIRGVVTGNKKNIFDNNSSPYYSDKFISFEERIVSVGISKIKFKNEKVNKFFEDNFYDFCSIHLRRGVGTNPTLGFVKDFLFYNGKEEFKTYLGEYYFNFGYCPPSNHYNIIPDSVYFSLIDEIISNNKLQKFYISSDIFESYYSYYFDRYSNNMKKKEEYFGEFLSFFDYDEDIDEFYSYLGVNTCLRKETLINLFDLFILAYSHTILVDGHSTWAVVASLIAKKKNKINVIAHTLIRDSISIDDFIKKYSYFQVTSIREKNNEMIK
jgi:hypothetical protein